jgi:hypothetical protein
MRLYHNAHHRPGNISYEVTSCETVFYEVYKSNEKTAGYEVFAAFGPFASKESVVAAVGKLIKAIAKRDDLLVLA